MREDSNRLHRCVRLGPGKPGHGAPAVGQAVRGGLPGEADQDHCGIFYRINVPRPVWPRAIACSPQGGSLAFTLIEMLVVIAVIAILAALLLPALRAGKTKAQGIQCLGQLKQFSYAWNMYADDHDERIPPNHYRGGPMEAHSNMWVQGWLDNDFAGNCADNTNTIYLQESLIAPYLAYSIPVWRCPGDKSSSRYGPSHWNATVRLPRVRSYSMNGFLNSHDLEPSNPWRMFRLRTEMIRPGPVMTFVFIDEREDSINDCQFAVDMRNEPPLMYSVPRSSHHCAGTLSFADGQAELKKWIDPITRLPVRQQTFFRPNPDVTWLRQRTTGPK
jgi:prepilin-type N-terminal cleavage/methylation domain-containing protein